jgi:hypothetical protein
VRTLRYVPRSKSAQRLDSLGGTGLFPCAHVLYKSMHVARCLGIHVVRLMLLNMLFVMRLLKCHHDGVGQGMLRQGCSKFGLLYVGSFGTNEFETQITTQITTIERFLSLTSRHVTVTLLHVMHTWTEPPQDVFETARELSPLEAAGGRGRSCPCRPAGCWGCTPVSGRRSLPPAAL